MNAVRRRELAVRSDRQRGDAAAAVVGDQDVAPGRVDHQVAGPVPTEDS